MLNSSIDHSNPSPQSSSINNPPKNQIQIVGYQCKNCQKVLSTKQSLREHSYIHTGLKPYSCKEPGCGQTFRQSSQLSYHKRIHLEIKKVFLSESKELPNISRSTPSLSIKEELSSKEVKLPSLPKVNLSEEICFPENFKFN